MLPLDVPAWMPSASTTVPVVLLRFSVPPRKLTLMLPDAPVLCAFSAAPWLVLFMLTVPSFMMISASAVPPLA